MDGAVTSSGFFTGNSTEPSRNYETTFGSLVLMMASLTLAMVIITLNSLTIYVIRKTQALQTLSNMYISSLAHVDLIVGVGVLLLSSFFVSYIKQEYFERYIRLCVFMNSFIIGAASVSTLHLMIISIDRCLYIKAPYFYVKNFNRKRIAAVIGFIWIFGAFYFCLPQLLLSKNGYGSIKKCDTTSVMPKEYIFHSNCAVFFTSLTVTFAMYGMILKTAAKHRRQIDALHVSSQRNKAGGDGFSVVTISEGLGNYTSSVSKNKTISSAKDSSVGHRQGMPLNCRIAEVEETDYHAEIQDLQNLDNATKKVNTPNQPFGSRSRRLQNSLKNIKFFATVFGVFVVCFTPSMVCMPLDYYVAIPRMIYNTASLIALTNSAANFIIFYWLNTTFRKAVNMTVRCSYCHRN